MPLSLAMIYSWSSHLPLDYPIEPLPPVAPTIRAPVRCSVRCSINEPPRCLAVTLLSGFAIGKYTLILRCNRQGAKEKVLMAFTLAMIVFGDFPPLEGAANCECR